MARPTKINELVWLVSFFSGGVTRTELLKKRIGSFVKKGKVMREVIYFPATTLDRLLKRLVDKGFVEKELVRSGRKGRPLGKYKIATKQTSCGWPVFTVPNMERNEEGKLFLVRTIRDCSLRSIGDNRKNVKKTFPLGDYFEEYSSVMGDRGIKINPYKERSSPECQSAGLTSHKQICRRCGRRVHFVIGTNELCPDCLESPKESPEP